jgi:hypothetical protein
VRNLEDEAATWRRGAVVQINQGGETGFRPALFVFALPGGGAAWVEPSYLDEIGAASPAFHAVAGPVEDVTPGGSPIAFFDLGGASWSATVYPADDDDPADVLEALRWALAELQRRGTTWEAERARILAEITAG